MKTDKLWNDIKYWGQALLLPVYWISFITPRNKRIWLFGSTFGNRFADNPKYLYLYINQYRKTDIRAIWISRNKEVVAMLKENKYEEVILTICGLVRLRLGALILPA